MIDRRDNSGKHSGFYHGNFVPQIPHQFIRRFTKAGDTVLDPFMGSGTTAYECETLARNFVGIDNTSTQFNQRIRSDIKDFYKNKKCVMLGVNGFSENTKIEIDHKDGRKNDDRVSDLAGQKLEDFQPLCKAANDAKRHFCKKCKETNCRWNAKNILGNPYPFYAGDEHYDEKLGCVGCYQYDPVEYRKQSVKRIATEASKNTSDFIMKKLYGDDE
jgi:hypothetical protein